ncbi:MAG: 50S ribosomal protein L10 [Planctomycetota bacterium]|jgi:large subunit ribosomal protein L10
MVNTLNQKITEEYTELFNEANDCVFVNFQGLTVEEINALRSSLTKNNINMQVIRTSLASIALKSLNRSGFEELLDGPVAVVWGGEGIVHVSKSVHEFAKKTKKLELKGGFLAADPINDEDVKKLTKVPEMPVLLGSIVSTFMDPLQSIAGGLGSLLSSIVNLVDALEKKKAAEGPS